MFEVIILLILFGVLGWFAWVSTMAVIEKKYKNRGDY